MPEFFQTVMGHKFYEGDVPEIVRQLKRIGDALDVATKRGFGPPLDPTVNSDKQWVMKLCSLVEESGETEQSRNEAFARLFDAVKATRTPRKEDAP